MRLCPRSRGSPANSLAALMSFAACQSCCLGLGTAAPGTSQSLAPQTERAKYQSWRADGGKALFLTVWLNGAAIRGK